MPVEPSVLIALAVFVGYTAVVSLIWYFNRVDYTTIADSETNVVRGIVVPIGVGGLLLSVATSFFGWWDLVLFEDRTSGPGWVWVVPVLLAVTALAGIATIDWKSPKVSIVPYLLVGTLIVGFSEELLTRGIVLVGLREELSEVWVWLGTCALFGLLHAINGLFGQTLRATVGQGVFAFAMGSAFYVTREITGTILVGMAVHAAWDFGILATQTTGRERSKFAGLLGLLTLVVGLAAGWVVAT